MKKNKDELKQILPHREPMLLLDSAELTIEKGDNEEQAEASTKLSIGTYTIRGDEHFLQGHFPDNPVVPGVILVEMMAQSSCLLFADSDDIGNANGDKTQSKLTFLTTISSAKFKKPVTTGDTLRMVTKLIKQARMFSFIEATAYVGDIVVATAELSFAVVNRN